MKFLIFPSTKRGMVLFGIKSYFIFNLFYLFVCRLSFACLGEPSNVSQSLSIRQYSQGSDFSELDRFLYKSKVLNLSRICDAADVCYCLVQIFSSLCAMLFSCLLYHPVHEFFLLVFPVFKILHFVSMFIRVLIFVLLELLPSLQLGRLDHFIIPVAGALKKQIMNMWLTHVHAGNLMKNLF